jgi:hypothetical protein
VVSKSKNTSFVAGTSRKQATSALAGAHRFGCEIYDPGIGIFGMDFYVVMG